MRTNGLLIAVLMVTGFSMTGIGANADEWMNAKAEWDAQDDADPVGDPTVPSLGTLTGASSMNIPLLSPQVEDLADRDVEDAWQVLLLPGDYAFSADTTVAATAADLWACLGTEPTAASCFDHGDDEMACTFPPPAFRCPSETGTVDAPGLYYIMVGAWDFSSPAGQLDYELTATTAGLPTTLLLLASDDGPETGP